MTNDLDFCLQFDDFTFICTLWSTQCLIVYQEAIKPVASMIMTIYVVIGQNPNLSK